MYFPRVAIITLTTDFGTADWFVGTMKGVMLSIAPQTTLVDLTHEVPPGDVRSGAFALAAACHYFPKGTIHLAVIDPGVGSNRTAMAVRTDRYVFVGPDNGVLSWALRHEKIRAIHRLENQRFFRPALSRTFHGRDLFAPVAAQLSRRLAISKLGPRLGEYQQLKWPEPEIGARAIRGEIVYVDRFGNAISNIPEPVLAKFAAPLIVSAKKARCPVKEFYQAVPMGRPVAVMGSSGLLEIALNGGDAARKFGLRTGDALVVRPAKNPRT